MMTKALTIQDLREAVEGRINLLERMLLNPELENPDMRHRRLTLQSRVDDLRWVLDGIDEVIKP